ncbi:MAG: hypothetical protein MK081_14720 [Flavobacteriales bacterium]|nr:hypothetical protein [Flavobacteriales bacterium]
MNNIKLLIIFCGLCLASCSGKVVTTTELLAEYDARTDAYQRSETRDGFVVQVKFVPSNVLYAKAVDANLPEIEKSAYDNFSQFVMRLSLTEQCQDFIKCLSSNNDDYASIHKHLSFDLSESLSIVDSNGRRIPCSGIHFDRTYNVTPFVEVTSTFEGVEQLSYPITFELDDEFFGIGQINFTFQDNYELPELIES